LLSAKEKGRNCVVQLGTGAAADECLEKPKGGVWRRRPADGEAVVHQRLTTPVPLQITLEKLRGFIADHGAQVLQVEGNTVHIQIGDRPARKRRFGDRAVVFRVVLTLAEEQVTRQRGEAPATVSTRTAIDVTVSPQKNRDRRRGDVIVRARDVLVSLRSYLMAGIADSPPEEDEVLGRSQPMIATWLTGGQG
jgi:hypothetical protein